MSGTKNIAYHKTTYEDIEFDCSYYKNAESGQYKVKSAYREICPEEGTFYRGFEKYIEKEFSL